MAVGRFSGRKGLKTALNCANGAGDGRYSLDGGQWQPDLLTGFGDDNFSYSLAAHSGATLVPLLSEMAALVDLSHSP